MSADGPADEVGSGVGSPCDDQGEEQEAGIMEDDALLLYVSRKLP